jgi:hypothetical protein
MRFQLKEATQGMEFSAFGDNFVVLERIGEDMLCIRRTLWGEPAAFDENGGNNFGSSTIAQKLEGYARELFRNNISSHELIEHKVNLKAADGTNDYGKPEVAIGLLTLEQYGKYRKLIPPAHNWWLATPVDTHTSADAPSCVWSVQMDGSYTMPTTTSNAGLRPVLLFSGDVMAETSTAGRRDARRTIMRGDFTVEDSCYPYGDGCIIFNLIPTETCEADAIFGTHTADNGNTLKISLRTEYELNDVGQLLEYAEMKGDKLRTSSRYLLNDDERKVLLELVLLFEINRMEDQIASINKTDLEAAG